MGYENGVRLLLQNGAHVNAVCKHIVNEQIEVESPTRDPRSHDYVSNIKNVVVRETALHSAALHGHRGVIVLLLASGADLSIPYEYDGEKRSVLEIAKNEETRYVKI